MLFVLDNSLRESTVGQIKGHTYEDKFEILKQVKKCKFKSIIVACFGSNKRVEDKFLEGLKEKMEEDKNGEYSDLDMYVFTDAYELPAGKVPETPTLQVDPVPVGLQKMAALGFYNPVIEIDLCDPVVVRDGLTKLTALIKLRLEYLRRESKGSEIKWFVNFRDFPFAMQNRPEDVFEMVKNLYTKMSDQLPVGVMFEEPTGDYLPEEMAAFVKAFSTCIKDIGWVDAKILCHVHEKWGLANAVQLECLRNGANGIWCSICEEGAGLGHASSSVTLMNLVRYGNKKVQNLYNCQSLRDAAIQVTKISSGALPYDRQVICGSRALDLAFNFGGIASGKLQEGEFDSAKFFRQVAPIRISTLSSASMVRDRLIQVFGTRCSQCSSPLPYIPSSVDNTTTTSSSISTSDAATLLKKCEFCETQYDAATIHVNPEFNEEMGRKMLEKITAELIDGHKENFMDTYSLCQLFDRSGGHPNEEMLDRVQADTTTTGAETALLNQVRAIWEMGKQHTANDSSGEDRMSFESFHQLFMITISGFPQFSSPGVMKCMNALDMDGDRHVDWKEFKVFLVWTIKQFPDVSDVFELLQLTFWAGIIPAGQDEDA